MEFLRNVVKIGAFRIRDNAKTDPLVTTSTPIIVHVSNEIEIMYFSFYT